MDAATMEDEWFARNMPGNIRTAEPAPNEAVPQFPLDALYPQQHNNTNNRAFDIQQLMRLNQNSPTSPALNSSSDSPTHMLLRLLGLIPGNPGGGDLPAGLPGVLDTTPTFKRQGLTVDNIDLSNGQLQNIQELLRNQQSNGLQGPQHSAALQVSAAEAAYLHGNSLEMPELGGMGRGGLGSSLQQHSGAQLQHGQHATDNHSMSNINVLSLLDPSNHSNLLGKQGNDGTQGRQYDGSDAFLTHRDLMAGGVSNGVDHNAWSNAPKSEPMQDNRMGGHATDSHHGAAESGSEKNMQDLLESVQRRNPVDPCGWKEVAMDVNVEPEKWPELKQCYENFRRQHPIAHATATVARTPARTDSPPVVGSRRSSARPSPVDDSLRPTTTPNKHGRRINPRKGIPMHIMATYALLRLPDHEGNLSDMSAKIEENAFFCKQLDWTPRPGTKTYPRWKDALVGCFKPGRYPHLKKTSRKKEGLTVYALMENSIPEKSCLKPSMLTDVDPASLPADFDMNNPLVPLRNANNRLADKGAHDTTSVVTTGIQPMGSLGTRGPLTGSGKMDMHAMPGMDSASLTNNGMGGRNSFNGLGMGFDGRLQGDVKPNVDVTVPGGIEQASALIAAAMQQHQQRQ